MEAPGRLGHGPPVAVLDIGSNSVRLVVYEGMTRSPTPIFNEKVMCGLGRAVATTGELAADTVEKALAAINRYRALCDVIEVGEIIALATAACRDARNGAQFIAEAETLIGADINILSGDREARLAALGVVSGFYKPDGIVGDLGGGSLELVDVAGETVGEGVSLPLGGLALQDLAEKSLKKAEKVVADAIAGVDLLKRGKGRPFYAVGGTWRALARLHMWQKDHPLHVMHEYRIPAAEVVDFTAMIRRVDTATLEKIDVVADARRPLLAYGALVLEQVVKAQKASEVVISALGVREGLLYERLDAETQALDPLIAAAGELCYLRSRSPHHGVELIDWTGRMLASMGIAETAGELRLRQAACLLADIGWRAHPDYRGEQSLNVVANAGFVGIDHGGRAFLALTVFHRHVGLSEEGFSPRIRNLAAPAMRERARLIGGAMRVAYLVSAAMPGVLPRTALTVEHGRLVLTLPLDLAALAGDRLSNRVKQLARAMKLEAAVTVR